MSRNLALGLALANNLADRGLRPLVITLKIGGGSRSPAGPKTRILLFILLCTWAAQGLNPFPQCLTLLENPTANAPLLLYYPNAEQLQALHGLTFPGIHGIFRRAAVAVGAPLKC